MRARVRKKLDERKTLQYLDELLSRTCGDVSTSCSRLRGLLAELNGSLSVFPLAVKDWITNPPIHQGEYILWFVRKDKPLRTRKYLFMGMGDWYDSKGNKVDMAKLKPAMWMMVPVISPAVLEVYKRREEDNAEPRT